MTSLATSLHRDGGGIESTNAAPIPGRGHTRRQPTLILGSEVNHIVVHLAVSCFARISELMKEATVCRQYSMVKPACTQGVEPEMTKAAAETGTKILVVSVGENLSPEPANQLLAMKQSTS